MTGVVTQFGPNRQAPRIDEVVFVSITRGASPSEHNTVGEGGVGEQREAVVGDLHVQMTVDNP